MSFPAFDDRPVTVIEAEPHRHRGGRSRVVPVGGLRRCGGCGHRLRVNGIPPRETRELVMAAGLAGIAVAIGELRDRRRARLIGRWTR